MKVLDFLPKVSEGLLLIHPEMKGILKLLFPTGHILEYGNINCGGWGMMLIEAKSLDRELEKPESDKNGKHFIVPDYCMICMDKLSPDDAIVYICGHGAHRRCMDNQSITKCCCCDTPLFEAK